MLLATGADVVARGPGGERTIPIAEFVVDFFTNALADDEMVTEVRIPVPAGRSGGSYQKLERKIGDYATVAVAAHLELAGDGTIAGPGVALTAVDPVNTKVTAAEAMLVGQPPSDELFAEAGELAAQASDPRDDVRGSAEWKRNVVRVFTRRALRRGGRAGSRDAARSEGDAWRSRHGQRHRPHRTTSSRACCSSTSSARKAALTGTHIGCDTTSCGACTVLLDGTPVKSCTMLAVQADGRSITTVEGLKHATACPPIQAAFKEEHGLQCGFCTPGMMLVGVALLEQNPDPTDDDVRWAISGNLCRCTGYMNIVKAIRAAAAAPPRPTTS